MSLLIKALDKAQEEAQLAKGKQPKTKPPQVKPSEVTLALQEKSEHDAKRQPAHLSTSVAEPSLSFSNAASEKLAAANALELELSPKIKPDIAAKPAVNTESKEASEDPRLATALPKALSVGLENKATTHSAPSNTASTSRGFASSRNGDETAAIKSSAANVFASKRVESKHGRSKVAFLIGVGLITLSAIAAYFYQWAQSDSDVAFLAQRPAMTAPVAPPTETVDLPNISAEQNNELASETVPEPVASNLSDASAGQAVEAIAVPQIKPLRLAQNEKVLDEVEAEAKSVKAHTAIPQESDAPQTAHIASKSASIQVSKSSEQPSVSPVLMRAYDAYNAGNDSDAIKLYKQVLQRDVRNVDALLGLGAIAQRQGRLQDANGWYGKVLELDPKNSMALGFNLANALNNQPTDDINSESRIKSMLAKQPDDANLHAALGNYYADLNQWSAAQQAYFDAYRLNANADNAFNLAISLDQLGKPKLALPYYQRALQLSQAATTAIDKAALEARIAAIQ